LLGVAFPDFIRNLCCLMVKLSRRADGRNLPRPKRKFFRILAFRQKHCLSAKVIFYTPMLTVNIVSLTPVHTSALLRRVARLNYTITLPLCLARLFPIKF
jgi:hypothetical protein